MVQVYEHVFAGGFEEAWARHGKAEDIVETFECFERGPVPGEGSEAPAHVVPP